jgi:phosphatidate cytidylyltransferase
MDYKNFILRSFFSILLLTLYLFSLENYNILLGIGILIYLIILIEIYNNFKINFNILLAYIILSFLCFIFYFIYFFEIFYFNLLLYSIVIFDTSSYLFGTLLGRNYLFTKISPKKTYEGLLGGVLFTNILFVVYIIFFSKLNYYLNSIFLINLIIIFSFIGDLLESYFKRLNNIKNSSSFLPGHGGFFDRFDSFILSIIFLLIYSFLYL